MAKAIEEVTYYCLECNWPLRDETKNYRDSDDIVKEVKTGDLQCPRCGKWKQGKRVYVQCEELVNKR